MIIIARVIGKYQIKSKPQFKIARIKIDYHTNKYGSAVDVKSKAGSILTLPSLFAITVISNYLD